MALAVEGTVVVDGNAVRRAWRGRPWLHREDIRGVEAAAGPFVDLVDENALSLGTALYDPNDEVPIRLVSSSRTNDPVGLLRTRLERALARRRKDLLGADAFRLCHGEGDGVPRLFVDRFGDGLVVTSVSHAMNAVTEALIDPLMDMTDARVVARYTLRSRTDSLVRTRLRRDAPFEVELCRGTDPQVRFHHGRLVRRVSLTSSFDVSSWTVLLDGQRFVRRWARGQVLHAFAGNGGFGLQMADAGASKVLFLDDHSDNLACIANDAKVNGLSERVTCLEVDPAEQLRKLGDAGAQFETVIVHPVELRESSDEVDEARRRVSEQLRRALRLLDEGGLLITWPGSTAISGALFEELLVEAATRSRKRLQVLSRLGAGPDHPTLLGMPELSARTLVVRVLATG